MQRFLMTTAIMVVGSLVMSGGRLEARGGSSGGSTGHNTGGGSSQSTRSVQGSGQNNGRPRPISANGTSRINNRPQVITGRGNQPRPQNVSNRSANQFRSYRTRPGHWGWRHWNHRFGCWCYTCPDDGCDYYWCAPYGCYFPVSYCPTGSFDYVESDGDGPVTSGD